MTTRKLIQALVYIAHCQQTKTLENIKAYKLLWLADKYQLRNCGRTITGDTYYAMPYGLVPSDAKNLLEGQNTLLSNDSEYMGQYIKELPNKKYMALVAPDCNEFSDSDIEALDKVIDVYGAMTPKELSDFSHQSHEWKEYSNLLSDKNKKNSYKVDIDLFFAPSTDALFEQSEELLSLTCDLYHQYHRG